MLNQILTNHSFFKLTVGGFVIMILCAGMMFSSAKAKIKCLFAVIIVFAAASIVPKMIHLDEESISQLSAVEQIASKTFDKSEISFALKELGVSL